MPTLYKRASNGKPLMWDIHSYVDNLGYDNAMIHYGLVGGTLHEEIIRITKKNVNEIESRIKAKRKEGYKELSELKDSSTIDVSKCTTKQQKLIILRNYLETYLPKYSTTSEGFVLPMLAKVLEDNKPFEKFGTMLGQWKIDGLRCIIGAEKNSMDLFNPITLNYHSRTGEDWTPKMKWMDEILLPKISQSLIDMMIEEGACLDGELYLPGYSVNDINSFVKNTQLANHYKLQYGCYDICCENMSATHRAEFLRMNTKNIIFNIQDKETHLNNKEQFGLLYTYIVPDFIYAEDIRNKFIDLGFEGLILRNPSAEYQFGKRNQSMLKHKKVDDGKFVIVDIISEHKRSDLPLFVLRNDINDELFECSINKPQSVQREMFAHKEKYIDKLMLVEFRNRSGIKQCPFHARGINII